MKILIVALAIILWFVFWFTIFASNFKTHAEPVVVPHCISPMIGMFLPCSDVDRYEYA